MSPEHISVAKALLAKPHNLTGDSLLLADHLRAALTDIESRDSRLADAEYGLYQAKETIARVRARSREAIANNLCCEDSGLARDVLRLIDCQASGEAAS